MFKLEFLLPFLYRYCTQKFCLKGLLFVKEKKKKKKEFEFGWYFVSQNTLILAFNTSF